MQTANLITVNSVFTVAITCFTLLTARGNPVGNTLQSTPDYRSTNRHELTSGDSVSQMSNCDPEVYELGDVIILENNDLFLKAKNITVPSSQYQKTNGRIFMCISPQREPSSKLGLNCTDKFEYEKNEFSILPNKSAIVDTYIVPEGEYQLVGELLFTCAPEEEESGGMTLQEISIYVGQAGSAISIVALMVHLLTYIFVPTLRNLPGYNLAALSVAFLLAYSFHLIGQIPQVLGLSCVLSAVLQQNFFLAAFFCMNVLAFDVWRTLKLATEKLAIGSKNSRKRQFIWYSLYAWGVPLVITTISVIADNCDKVPANIRPDYGKYDVCWMNNMIAKAVFFVVPAFSLLLVNVVFFVMSSWMISSNTLKVTKDQSKQTAKINYILYVKLALMMGLTWLVGLIAIIWREDVIWFIFDLLNSLQGLFLFLLFSCTKKVFKQLAGKSKMIKLSTVKQTTLTSNSSSVSTKMDSNGVISSVSKPL